MSDSKLILAIWGRKHSETIPNGIRHYWNAEHYAVSECGEDSYIRDENHIKELVDFMVSKDSGWHRTKPEETDTFKPWFTVTIDVSNGRKKIADYQADYFKHEGCPLVIINQGMDIYRTIKRNMRKLAEVKVK